MDSSYKTVLFILLGMTLAANCHVIPEPSDDATAERLIRLPREPKSKVTDLELNAEERQTPQKLLLFVKKHRAEQCLQRIICQLSFNEKMFGEEGYQFANRLKAMESMVKEADIILYRESRIFGLSNKDPENCIDRYSDNCEYTANEIIRIGLRLTNKLERAISARSAAKH